MKMSVMDQIKELLPELSADQVQSSPNMVIKLDLKFTEERIKRETLTTESICFSRISTFNTFSTNLFRYHLSLRPDGF